MKVLMLGNTCSVGYDLSRGLKQLGAGVTTVWDSVSSHTKHFDGEPDTQLTWKPIPKNYFDIIHIHYPDLKKYNAIRKLTYDKLICHWHGRDLKLNKTIARYFLKKADFHLYSTIDLAYYLRSVKRDKQEHFLNPVDIDKFYPYLMDKPFCTLLMDNDARNQRDIPTHYMNKFYNQYQEVEIFPRDNMSVRLVSKTALECAAAGLKVKHHPYMTRGWILENASIEVRALKLLDIYRKLYG